MLEVTITGKDLAAVANGAKKLAEDLGKTVKEAAPAGPAPPAPAVAAPVASPVPAAAPVAAAPAPAPAPAHVPNPAPPPQSPTAVAAQQQIAQMPPMQPSQQQVIAAMTQCAEKHGGGAPGAPGAEFVSNILREISGVDQISICDPAHYRAIYQRCLSA